MSKKKKKLMEVFTTQQLADRWKIRTQTLQKWRVANEGPRYIKIGGRVMYRIDEIIRYEQTRTFCGTSCRDESNE